MDIMDTIDDSVYCPVYLASCVPCVSDRRGKRSPIGNPCFYQLLWTVWTTGGQVLSSIVFIVFIVSILRRRRLAMLNPSLQAGVASSPRGSAL